MIKIMIGQPTRLNILSPATTAVVTTETVVLKQNIFYLHFPHSGGLAGRNTLCTSQRKHLQIVPCHKYILHLACAIFVFQVVVYFYPNMPHHVIVYHLTVTLSSLNSCMDPVVYCFVTNNFQVRKCFSRPIISHPLLVI